MTGNIYEHSKEISVMRAVGFPTAVITRLFIYEAFILVVSSAFSGMMIGTIVGWTITMQQCTFSQMPLFLTFP